jgi:uncharacterized membrane protein
MYNLKGIRAIVSGRRSTDVGRRPYVSRQRAMLLVAVAFGLLVFGLAWYRHASYRSRIFDLAEFDQALWLLAHGHAPIATVIGRNIFTVHFSAVLVVFVPLYMLAATPIWLLAAQAVALAVGFLAIGPLLDELGVTNKAWRAALLAAYVASPFLWNAALFDFHSSTLAVPFLIMGMTAALRDDSRALILTSLGAVLCLESLGLGVAAVSLVGYGESEHRRFRILLGLAGVAWALLIGRLGNNIDSPDLWLAHYGYLGQSLGAALHHPTRTMIRLGQQLWSGDNLTTILAWLVPLGFLPLLSPRRAALGLIWVFPLLVSAVFSDGSLGVYHHGVMVLPFLLLAAATATTKLRSPRLDFVGPVILGGLALSALWIFNPFGEWIFDTPAPPRQVAAEGLSHIQADDVVTATPTLGPHLAHRTVLLPFPYPFVRGDEQAPLNAEVTEMSREAVGRVDAVAMYLWADWSTSEVVLAFRQSPELSQFRLVFARDGLFVYRRVEPNT